MLAKHHNRDGCVHPLFKQAGFAQHFDRRPSTGTAHQVAAAQLRALALEGDPVFDKFVVPCSGRLYPIVAKVGGLQSQEFSGAKFAEYGNLRLPYTAIHTIFAQYGNSGETSFRKDI